MSPGAFSDLRIAILGGGIIGMSIAWRLAQRGFSVSVFDRSLIGGEASWAGAGMLAPGGELEAASELSSLAIESRGMYSSFVQELSRVSGLSIDYQDCGALDLAFSEQDWLALSARAERQAQLGIQSKSVSVERVAAFWPRVRTADLAGALFYPGDGIVNPRELMAALLIACRKAGVPLFENCEAKSARVSESRVQVETPCGVVQFDGVVIAAGAWSGNIRVEGIPPLPPSEPVKGHLIGYHQPDQTCNTILRHGHTYILQRASGLLIAGASVERVGFDRTIDQGIASRLALEAARMLPHLAETTPSETWAGLRPGSEALQMGRWHSPRLQLAYGHYRNGILLAPVTAERAAAEVSANLRML